MLSSQAPKATQPTCYSLCGGVAVIVVVLRRSVGVVLTTLDDRIYNTTTKKKKRRGCHSLHRQYARSRFRSTAFFSVM